MSKQVFFKGVPIVWDEDQPPQTLHEWWGLPSYQPHRTEHHTLLLEELRKSRRDSK